MSWENSNQQPKSPSPSLLISGSLLTVTTLPPDSPGVRIFPSYLARH